MSQEVDVDRDDPCTCGAGDEEGLLVNKDIIWGDGEVIHDPNVPGGCGKFMRCWDSG